MQWTVQVSVVLLNIVWIAFFIHPDPLSVFVQRRSSDDEMLFGEFCIELPLVKITKTNSNSTTSEENPSLPVNKTKSPQDCIETNTQEKHQYTSESSHTELRPAAPGCEPKILDRKETTNHPHFVLGQTTTARPVLGPGSRTPVKETDLTPPAPGAKPKTKDRFNINLDNCCWKFYPKRIKKDLLISYQMTDHRCLRKGVIFVTQKSHRICVDPSLSWVQNIMKTLDEKSF
ncbi:uncharacterized protein LOC113123009 [Mastacembelus armatus]|uniref:uncharacterized protein LOC113123009 n=1 Tax=Mastacembelus armatus TaxID=205130 RepID=UPI000E461A91|nr:uncharacterized protein LOC113123009 [Mastacembelus armatus]